jgi:ATP-dependent DNA helicase RecG
MHQLGVTESKLEEPDSDVLVTIRHEPLASPEQAIMRYLDNHDTIKNKQAREITYIRDSDQMTAHFEDNAAKW